jgi:hypothetical protein
VNQELTGDKTKVYLLIIECLALGTAAVLILIDYKIKQDLVGLFKQVEAAIYHESRIHCADTDNYHGDSGLPDSALVGDNAIMETTDVPVTASASAPGRKTASRNKTPDSRAGTRSKKVPDTDKSVGS